MAESYSVKAQLTAEVDSMLRGMKQALDAVEAFDRMVNAVDDSNIDVNTKGAISAIESATSATELYESQIEGVSDSNVDVNASGAINALDDTTSATDGLESALGDVEYTDIDVNSRSAISALDDTTSSAELYEDSMMDVSEFDLSVENRAVISALGDTESAADDLEDAMVNVEDNQLNVDHMAAIGSLDDTAAAAFDLESSMAEVESSYLTVDNLAAIGALNDTSNSAIMLEDAMSLVEDNHITVDSMAAIGALDDTGGAAQSLESILADVSNNQITIENQAALGAIQEVSSSIDRLNSSLAGIDNTPLHETSSAASGVERSVESASVSIGSLAAAVGAVWALNEAFNLVSGSIDRATARIDTMEQFERTMTAITGSAEDAATALDRTNESVTGTAYGLDIAAKSVQNFVTRGVEIGKATEYVAAWGDAVAFYGDGTNEQLTSVTDALGKMLTTNKVTMDQMNRLYDVGINATGMYAEATNKSVNEVEEALRKGDITATEFVDTVTEAMMEGTNGVLQIAGAAQEAGNSWGNVFTNMRAAVSRGTISIIESIDNMLTSNGLPDMRLLVAEFGSHFETVLKQIAEGIPAVVEWIQQVYESLKPWIPLIQQVIIAFAGFVAVYAILGTLIGLFNLVRNTLMELNLPLIIIAGLIAALGYVVYDLWQTNEEFRAGMIEIWNQVQEAMTQVFDLIASWSPVVIEYFMNILESIKPWTPEILAAVAVIGLLIGLYTGLSILTTQFGNLAKAISMLNVPLVLISAGILALAAVVIYLWQTNEEFRTNIMSIWDSIQILFSSVFQAILPLFDVFVTVLFATAQAMVPLFAWVVNLTAVFLNWIATIIQNNQWMAQMALIIGVVIAALRSYAIVTAIVTSVTAATRAIMLGAAGAMAIYQGAMAIATGVTGLFGTVAAIAFSPVTLIVLGVVAAIGALGGILVWAYNKFEWFHNMLSPIVDGLKGLWDGFLGVLGFGTKEATEEATESINAMGDETGATTAEMSATNQGNISEMADGMAFDINSMSMNGLADFEMLNGGASIETSNMLGNVTGDMSEMHSLASTEMLGMNTDVLSAFESMNAGATLDASVMNSSVTSDASDMSSNVKSDVSDMSYMAIADISAMSGNVSGEVSSMSSSVSGDVSSMTDLALSDISSLSSGATVDFDSMTSDIMSDSSEMDSHVSTDFSNMNNTVQSEMNNIQSSTTTSMNNINRDFTKSLSNMVNVTENQLRAMVSATKSGMSLLVSAFDTGLSNALRVLRNGMSAIVSAMRSYESAMNAAGSFLMQGFNRGINTQGRVAINSARRIANQVAATMRKALDIHSPSRVTEEIGEFTGEGLGIGLENMIRYVSRMAEKLGLAATPDLSTVDIAGHVNSINRQATAQMQNHVTSELNVEKQPANITLSLGNNEYHVFVDDITRTQQRVTGRQRNRKL